MAQYTSISGVRLLILVLAFGFFAYILGPPLYWHFVGDGSRMGGSCAPCLTECPEDVATQTALADLQNVTLPACPKIDKDMEDELQKTKYVKLQEEMKLEKQVAEDAQKKSNGALLEAKKTASQFQKDFEKCNSGMETSEGAREKAEKLLAETRKTVALWEARAKKLGWKADEETETTDTETTTLEDADEERRETEEETSKTTEEKKPMPTSKNGQQIREELNQNLAVARFLYDRAVNNEMSGVKVARERALKLNLL